MQRLENIQTAVLLLGAVVESLDNRINHKLLSTGGVLIWCSWVLDGQADTTGDIGKGILDHGIEHGRYALRLAGATSVDQLCWCQKC